MVCGDGTPTQIMRDFSLVAALVEICVEDGRNLTERDADAFKWDAEEESPFFGGVGQRLRL
jgi:hypothetical protein